MRQFTLQVFRVDLERGEFACARRLVGHGIMDGRDEGGAESNQKEKKSNEADGRIEVPLRGPRWTSRLLSLREKTCQCMAAKNAATANKSRNTPT